MRKILKREKLTDAYDDDDEHKVMTISFMNYGPDELTMDKYNIFIDV